MSFSYDVKEELSSLKNFKNKELLEAEFLGYILTGNATLDGEKVYYITENEYNIERLFKILFNLEIDYEPEIKGKFFEAIIDSKVVSDRFLKFANVSDDEIKKNIIKGAFLGAGSISDPEKNYHVEINFGNEKNAEFILNLCKIYQIEFKILEVNPKYILYLKEGEQISKFLACIGANNAVLKFEDIRVYKEMKNNVNRIVNMETANLNKTIDAAILQIEDIQLIQSKNKFDDLPEELKEVAILRLENPEASLKELGEMLSTPLSKSGVNHRLKKIQEYADELKIKGVKN